MIENKFYVVKKGDNLYNIANLLGVDLKKFMEFNKIKNPNKLQIGDTLRYNESILNLPEGKVNKYESSIYNTIPTEGEQAQKELEAGGWNFPKENNQLIDDKGKEYKVYSIKDVLSPKFIDYIKHHENSIMKGYDPKTNTWGAYNSLEGGAKTIGYGTKVIGKTHPFYNEVKAGKRISDERINKQMYNDLVKYYNQVRDYLNSFSDPESGIMIGDTVSPQIMQAGINAAYQTGNIKYFPKFIQGVIEGNPEKMRKELKIFYTDPNGNIKVTNRSKGSTDFIWYK